MTDDIELVFEEPRPATLDAGTERMLAVCEAMKKYPGQWVKIREYRGNSSATEGKTILTNAMKRGLLTGKYELTVRNARKGETGSALYGKYNGDKQT